MLVIDLLLLDLLSLLIGPSVLTLLAGLGVRPARCSVHACTASRRMSTVHVELRQGPRGLTHPLLDLLVTLLLLLRVRRGLLLRRLAGLGVERLAELHVRMHESHVFLVRLDLVQDHLAVAVRDLLEHLDLPSLLRRCSSHGSAAENFAIHADDVFVAESRSSQPDP